MWLGFYLSLMIKKKEYKNKAISSKTFYNGHYCMIIGTQVNNNDKYHLF